MSFTVNVEARVANARRFVKGALPKHVQTATVRALNKAIGKVNTLSIRAASREIGIAGKHLRRKTKLIRANRARLEAVLRFSPRGINPLRIGMTPAQAQKFYKSPHLGKAFVMTMPNASQQIVVRLPRSAEASAPLRDAKGRLRKGRLPVKSLRIFVGKKTIAQLQTTLDDEGAEVFEREFHRQLVVLGGL